MPISVAGVARLTPLNGRKLEGEMCQRQFPWMAIAPAPRDADPRIVALCKSTSEALAATLVACRSKLPARAFAAQLGISSAYLSQIKKGVKPLQPWMIAPICALAGTNLLSQYIDAQDAVAEHGSERQRIEAVARALMRAAA